jgi:hypothetical protein
MNKYYKSYFLIDSNVLTESEAMQATYLYNTFYSEELDCMIAEHLDEQRKIIRVLYTAHALTDELFNFHNTTYGPIRLVLSEQLKRGVKMTFFNGREILLYAIATFNTDGSSHLFQEFNSDFELLEYKEKIYGENREQVLEKIFFANSWTIHEEKIL